MNNFLKNRGEVDAATQYLADNNLIQSGISCKNWEIRSLIPYLKDGDLLDLGSDGSVVLENAVKLGIKGLKWGIDLAYAGNRAMEGDIVLLHGDLMDTGFEDNSFDIITCLSVIEHEVDFNKFAKECSRLLRVGGKIYVSFDYWQPKPDYEKRKLYNLDWNILDWNNVMQLVYDMAANGSTLSGNIDWTLQDAVINDTYCSPVKDVSYTFGILEFIKK